ncbi:hypothetical protein SEMRO_238_G095700.1 [Seminavis robusta]|uniref:Uncharacterized protein n=1 Tax=Seminavis robusta TaxID=568900 RepID=A0A9N8DS06_9STRA|nr:hypothetical protein SEMRO_238_G095700.1 [Seminavis robusta]|eukprot:Sro238_g095700.1 n/a (296) ;mRNA; r:83295-84182
MKSNHRLFPKEELQAKMKGWSSGSSLVMECCSPRNGQVMLAIGYKYNKRKVLCFLATKNAGSTKQGKPYIAKFADSIGNVCYREVDRPKIISDYFIRSNVIDSHNHARQGELKMEKRWVTQDCWFRLDTTLIGMTVTDCWRAFRHHVADAKAKEMSVVSFADRVASDCLRNKFPDTIDADTTLNLMPTPVLTVEVPTGYAADDGGVSPISVASTIADLSNAHTRIVNPDQQASGRPKRRTCRADGCKKETHWMCGNQACMSDAYNANGRRVRGMFYCDAHWPLEHWKDLHPTADP